MFKKTFAENGMRESYLEAEKMEGDLSNSDFESSKSSQMAAKTAKQCWKHRLSYKYPFSFKLTYVLSPITM